ncbi:MAG: ribonuclease P protein component [Clostridiales bacterium]|nr:ribonuclease P protein component [Clostridiales bacterium]
MNKSQKATKNWSSLNDNKDFVRLYKRGKNVVTPVFVLYFNKNNLPYNRIGITTSKKIGNAVKRNRARRVIKAAIINSQSVFPIGYDFVFVARVRSTKEKSTVVEKYMRITMDKQFSGRGRSK